MKRIIDIPDNATNGDVIKAIFPNGTTAKFATFMRFIDGEHYFNCSEDWWNAPYHKGGNSEYLGGMKNCVLMGKPLPKGCGRLIDADALRKEVSSWVAVYEPSDFTDEIDRAPTIIEADNVEHGCCFWQDGKCVCGKSYCPDDYRCDYFD